MAEAREVEVEMCCDALLDAIQGGGIQVVEIGPGVYREVVPDDDGSSGIAVNFCPFCGHVRGPQGEAIVSPDQL